MGGVSLLATHSQKVLSPFFTLKASPGVAERFNIREQEDAS